MTDSHPQRIAAGMAVALALLAATILTAARASHAADAVAKAKMELGREVFTKIATPRCSICHTLTDAGATGTIGAKLEELKPDQMRVLAAVRMGVGIMPPYLGKLTDAQIEAVAYYVSRAARAK